MLKEPLVSILMPAYNAEAFVGRAIESVLNQTCSNWELLVLDDASTDSTAVIVNSFQDQRIKVYSNGENQGYLLSCNQLFEKANGEFVTFLDADDTSTTNRITDCLSAFERSPSLDFVTTNHVRVDKVDALISSHKVVVDYTKYASDPSYYPTICCATIFLRKALLSKVGGYHPFFKNLGGEDYHWLFRLSLVGDGAHLSQQLYKYRQHASQTHMRNNNPLRYFAEDIDSEIRQSVLNNCDALLNPELLLEKWNVFLSNHQAELHLRKASEALNSNEKARFKQELTMAVSAWPTSLRIVKKAIYLLYSFVARNT